MERKSGILMPISSLPSKHGIGTFGKEAYKFADFLAAAGQRAWQLLPLGPTSYGDSPYSSFSTYAGNPYFIDLDMLVADGLLTKAEVEAPDWGDDPANVDYGKIYENRFNLLRLACERGWDRDAKELTAFREQNAGWLPDYALFMALKRHFGMVSWTLWPDEAVRLRRPESLDHYRRLLDADVRLFTYAQFLFFKQWTALREYVHSLDIEIIGDLPIYVALDSSDVWADPKSFLLDEKNIPTCVSGVPPDYFCEDGQLWGNPIYNWERMRSDGYGWWIRRIEGAKKLYDVIRIDHFRGFESYWSVPYGEETAKNGKWMPGPGMSLVGVLRDWFHDTKFIAEDLGFLTPGVEQLLRRHSRQRDVDAMVRGRQPGRRGLRGPIPRPQRRGRRELGCHPRRHVQCGAAVCGADAGLSGPGRGGAHERARHVPGQLALAHAARRRHARARRQDPEVFHDVRPLLGPARARKVRRGR